MVVSEDVEVVDSEVAIGVEEVSEVAEEAEASEVVEAEVVEEDIIDIKGLPNGLMIEFVNIWNSLRICDTYKGYSISKVVGGLENNL